MVLSGLMAGVNTAALESLPRKYPRGPARNADWLKFSNWRQYGQQAIDRVAGLGLRGKQDILDVGCGFGYELRAFRLGGHNAVGIDLDDPIYAEVWRIMGVDVIRHALTLGVPLPLEVKQYDLITMWGFGLHRVNDPVGLRSARTWEEYREPMRALIEHLKPGGRLHAVPNAGRDWMFSPENWQQLGGRLSICSGVIEVRT